MEESGFLSNVGRVESRQGSVQISKLVVAPEIDMQALTLVLALVSPSPRSSLPKMMFKNTQKQKSAPDWNEKLQQANIKIKRLEQDNRDLMRDIKSRQAQDAKAEKTRQRAANNRKKSPEELALIKELAQARDELNGVTKQAQLDAKKILALESQVHSIKKKSASPASPANTFIPSPPSPRQAASIFDILSVRPQSAPAPPVEKMEEEKEEEDVPGARKTAASQPPMQFFFGASRARGKRAQVSQPASEPQSESQPEPAMIEDVSNKFESDQPSTEENNRLVLSLRRELASLRATSVPSTRLEQANAALTSLTNQLRAKTAELQSRDVSGMKTIGEMRQLQAQISELQTRLKTAEQGSKKVIDSAKAEVKSVQLALE